MYSSGVGNVIWNQPRIPSTKELEISPAACFCDLGYGPVAGTRGTFKEAETAMNKRTFSGNKSRDNTCSMGFLVHNQVWYPRFGGSLTLTDSHVVQLFRVIVSGWQGVPVMTWFAFRHLNVFSTLNFLLPKPQQVISAEVFKKCVRMISDIRYVARQADSFKPKLLWSRFWKLDCKPL